MITENELKMYLGTNTKCQCWNGEEWVTKPFNTETLNWYEPSHIRLILHPLEMLTNDVLNEIFNADGELDIKRYDNVPNQLTIIVSYQQMGETFKDIVCTRNIVEFTPYWIVKKLIELKFDIHNLIQQGKALAVTNEFNPYK